MNLSVNQDISSIDAIYNAQAAFSAVVLPQIIEREGRN